VRVRRKGLYRKAEKLPGFWFSSEKLASDIKKTQIGKMVGMTEGKKHVGEFRAMGRNV